MWVFWWIFGRIVSRLAEWWTGCRTPDGWGKCPWCGFLFDWADDPRWFRCSRSGQYAPLGDATVHWFAGVQTCPRCRHTWEYSDSD